MHITRHPQTAALIRRARRVADYLQAEVLAVGVRQQKLRDDDEINLEKHLNFARNLHINTETIEGENVPEALVSFARHHKVTQIYITSPDEPSWQPLWKRSLAQQVVRLARDMRVVIVSNRGQF